MRFFTSFRMTAVVGLTVVRQNDHRVKVNAVE